MTFEDLDLHPRLLAGLGPLARNSPTPVQEQALPAILEGQNVLVLAPAADEAAVLYALPMLQHTLFGPRGRIQAVVLAPTQEVVESTLREFAQVGKHTRVRTLALSPGQTIAQTEALRDGTEIVIACPAQVIEHLTRGSIDLSRVSLLALVHLDQLLDMGFLPHLCRIVKAAAEARQTLAFSSTANEALREQAQTLLNEPVIIQVGDVASAPEIEHAFYDVDSESKTEALLTLLDFKELPTEAALVFCETRFRARRLGERLKHARYAPAILTEDLSPRRRQLAIEGFINHTLGIIVTTDAAAQGLNVTGITHVVNFDMPANVETYLHRAGRAAYNHTHCAAVSLVGPEDADIAEAITLELTQPPKHRALPLGSD